MLCFFVCKNKREKQSILYIQTVFKNKPVSLECLDAKHSFIGHNACEAGFQTLGF